jgi:hypothetical protein
MGITKSLRRSIHIQIGNILDKECKGCKFRERGSYKSEFQRYCSKECPVGQELQRLSNELLLDEGKAQWSEEQDFYLVNHLKKYSVHHLAIRLNRSHEAVKQRINYLSNVKEKNSRKAVN